MKKWMVIGVSGAIALAMGSLVFAQEMVKDPSTGKMIKAPQYGGTIVIADDDVQQPHTDAVQGNLAFHAISLVLEKLGMADWSVDRDKHLFDSYVTPREIAKPILAESCEMPDPLTIIFKIRKGVHWHNKAPMNGRELTADDVVFNYHRVTGLGSGFTEKSLAAANISNLPIESITAPDKYTVVFKLSRMHFFALEEIYYNSPEGGWIYPPEVIKEHGDAQDWKTIVGTGPYMLTDWVEGSQKTWTKNPDYWGYDEKFPENRLPYADKIKNLIIKDQATKLSALRTGKIVHMRAVPKDQAESLQRTNPELIMTTRMAHAYPSTAIGMHTGKPPFDDVRVRTAMQLAIDIETLNNALFGGKGLTPPSGIVGKQAVGFYVPYDEWPDQLKADYGYDPARAKKLLAEAGYPDGFKTVLNYRKAVDANLEYALVARP